MPGPSNASNRFGSSSYVVGTVANGLGNGVNFTSIQAAYDQAVADGYGAANPTTIEIRPGTYIESITMPTPGIALEGVLDANGAFLTNISGSITIGTPGFGFYFFDSLNITGAGSSAFISVAAGILFVFCRNCTMSGSDPGFYGMELSNVSGTISGYFLTECTISGDLAGIRCNVRQNIAATNCNIVGNTDGVILDGTSLMTLQTSSIIASNGAGVITIGSGHTISVFNSQITASGPCVDLTAGGFCRMYESVMDSQDASGNFIVGTGNYQYCDVVNRGSSIGIDPGLGVITVDDWKPYGEAGAGPAPSLGTVRGTACFDSGSFTVTDGFVELGGAIPGSFPTDSGTATPVAGVLNVLGGPGVRTFGIGNTVTVASVEFNDVAAPTGLASDTGYFSSGAIALTLPAAPGQGEMVQIGCVTAGAIVTANAGQTIRIGNTLSSVAGTATSTDDGDGLILRYNAANTRWQAMSVIGNFTVA